MRVRVRVRVRLRLRVPCGHEPCRWHAARDQPLLAGEGAVAGKLVLDGLGRVLLEVCRQARVGLLRVRDRVSVRG